MLESDPTPTTYEVDIKMSPETVTKLLDQDFFLYGFKAVVSTQGSGSPLVWFKTQIFSATTSVTWEEKYMAYTSISEISPNLQIAATFSENIKLGQTLNVTEGGEGTVTTGGPSDSITIMNTTTTPYTCGISQYQDANTPKTLCAFPLNGLNGDVIAPIEKVLFMFSTLPYNTGTVIEQAYSTGILIDLTGGSPRVVSYDINTGWDWDSNTWAEGVPVNTGLVPLLITTSSSYPKLVTA